MRRANWLIVVAIALGLLVPVGTANAAPAQVRVLFRNSYLRVRAPTDRPVSLTVFLNEGGVVTLRDAFGRITPGPGCVAVSAREVECDHPAASNVNVEGSPFDDLVRVRYPAHGFSGFGGEGDDRFHGQAGDDLFFAGPGDDELRGRGGDDNLYGDDGDDRLFGGSGDDGLHVGVSSFDSPDGPDEVSGGDGRDRVVFGYSDPVRVSLNDAADDGMIGEHDNVLSDVEDIFGSAEDDVLEGDGDDNQLRGENGNDVLIGGGGDDQLAGRRGDDRLVGGQGDDTLIGADDNDDLFGRRGDDHLDTVDDAHPSRGLRRGRLRRGDLVVDRAVCGAGIDVATVDAMDHVSASCETVNVVA